MANPSCGNCDLSRYDDDERCWCEKDDPAVATDELSICEDYEPAPYMLERVEVDCRCAGSSVFNRASCSECNGRGYVVREVIG